MKHITELENFISEKPSVVTLGKFDGVHRGHRKLLARVHEISRRRGYEAAVFTFSVSPQVQMGARKAKMLMTNRERASYLREQNIDLLIECPFTEEIRTMEAGTFVEKILVRRMQAKAVVVGTDFRFGLNRAGTPDFLKQYEEQGVFTVDIIEKEKDTESIHASAQNDSEAAQNEERPEPRDISSTYIREELAAGHMEKVHELLGYPYFVTGEIVHGRHLGHTLGFPTINQVPDPEKMLPPNGVYISRTRVGGKWYQGVSNIGVKPTVDGSAMGIETYLFDCSLDLYGQKARVELLSYRRPEMKFASIDELKNQMDSDIQSADEYFSMIE